MATTQGMGDYLRDAFINSVLRNTAFPAEPANVYVGLFTTATAPDGSGTEVTGGSYARVAVSTTGGWDAPTGDPSATQNSADITFTQATANWGTVTHYGIFTASSGGNLLFWGPLASSRTINNGDIAKFLAGALDLTVQ